MKYLLIITVALFLLPTVLAQSPSCPIQSPNPGVSKGLISAPALSGNLGSDTGACVIDPKASFAPFKIPSYEDLKSLYYTQAKTKPGITKQPVLSGNKTHSDIPLTTGTDHLYHLTGDLTIDGNISGGGSQVGVIFVDGNVYVNVQVDPTAGLVFVVKGDIIINPLVTTVNAVLISQGIIHTAGAGCNTNTIPASALTINGSLISLNTILNIPIKFCRTLADNSLPAEKIINQPKYLVILRNLLSDTYQKWSEIQ